MHTYPTPLVERSPLCGDDINRSMLRQPPNGGRSPLLPPLTGLSMLPNLVRLKEPSMWDQMVVPPPLRLLRLGTPVWRSALTLALRAPCCRGVSLWAVWL